MESETFKPERESCERSQLSVWAPLSKKCFCQGSPGEPSRPDKPIGTHEALDDLSLLFDHAQGSPGEPFRCDKPIEAHATLDDLSLMFDHAQGAPP